MAGGPLPSSPSDALTGAKRPAQSHSPHALGAPPAAAATCGTLAAGQNADALLPCGQSMSAMLAAATQLPSDSAAGVLPEMTSGVAASGSNAGLMPPTGLGAGCSADPLCHMGGPFGQAMQHNAQAGVAQTHMGLMASQQQQPLDLAHAYSHPSMNGLQGATTPQLPAAGYDAGGYQYQYQHQQPLQIISAGASGLLHPHHHHHQQQQQQAVAALPVIDANTVALLDLPLAADDPAKLTCQVAGCGKHLGDLKDYHQRYRICDVHIKLPQVRTSPVLNVAESFAWKGKGAGLSGWQPGYGNVVLCHKVASLIR